MRDQATLLVPRKPWLLGYVLVALLVPALLVCFGLWLRGEYGRMHSAGELVKAIDARHADALELVADMRQAETAQRGFVITHDPAFLKPYAPARAAVGAKLAELDGNLAKHQRVGNLIRAKFAEMDEVIADVRGGNDAAGTARVADGKGRLLMERINARLGAAIAADADRLAVNRATFWRRTQQSQQIIWILVTVLSAFLVIGLALLWSSRRQRWRMMLAAADASARNRAILDSTSDAIVILNPSGTIESVNATARVVLGYEPAELRRRDVSVLLDIADGDGSFYDRIGLVDGRLQRQLFLDRIARAKDGREVPVDVALGLMPVPDGLHVVASIRDISDRREVERLKDDFVATVSHELRTPLTSVVGSLGLLRGGTAGVLPSAAQQLVEIAENNARRLIRLTNDILDLEKVSAGLMVFDMAPVDLVEVLRQAAAEVELLAAGKSIRLQLDPPDQPLPILADNQRLLQVFSNLLANAIRHGPAGTVVTVAAALKDGRAVTRINDQGPGVPAKFRDSIFDRFVQAPSTAGGGGTGLGLAISREIIARHHGSIWVEESRNGGASFVVALDCRRSAPEHQEARRLLVCEADGAALEVISSLAAEQGYDVDSVADIDAIQAAVVKRRYAAVVVGLDLPGGSGLDVAHLLRTKLGFLDLPVIIVSGANSDERSEPVPFDLVDWINRPIDEARLQQAIRAATCRTGTDRPTILQIEDDVDLAAIISAMLADEARVVHATDLASARRLLVRERPEVVLLDIGLPDGSGLDLLPMLVDDEGCAIPTIVFSAQDGPAELRSDVEAVLIKAPTAIPDLKATVQRVLARKYKP